MLSNLPNLIGIADAAIRKIKSSGVFLYGRCKNGKSTFFNSFHGLPMIGVKKGMMIIYEVKIHL